jgi:hypothetical protein
MLHVAQNAFHGWGELLDVYKAMACTVQVEILNRV